MKLNRRKLRELINEAIYGSSYHKRPRDPSMHVTPQIRKKISQLTTSDSEEDRRAGYQLALPLQQDELVFPNDNSTPYEELPYKGSDYVDDINDFNNKASDKEIVELNKAVTHVANLMGSKDKGYRALTNIGNDGGQEVPHLHFHIFAGEKIGKMVS